MSEDWPGQPEQAAEAWPGQPEPSGVPAFTGSDGIEVAKNVYPSLGPILSAMGHGAKDGWGDEPLGLSSESIKWLSDKKIFGPEKGGYDNPFQAFNEMLAHTVVGAWQIAGRTGSALLGGYQAGMAETGEQVGAPALGRDLAAMPEAFFGSPHALGEIKMRSGLPKDVPLGKPLAGLSPAPAPGFDAYHGSPYSFDAFSTAHIGAGEGAQAYGHGLYFAQNEKVAEGYREQLKQWTIDGKPADETNPSHVAAATLEHYGDKAKAIEDLEISTKHGPQSERDVAAKAIDLIKEDAPLPKAKASGNLYQVRVNADQGKMLDWDSPLSEQPAILAALQDVTPKPGWLARQIEGLKVIRHEMATNPDSTGATAYGALQRLVGKDKASELLHDAGIPGIRYLDQGSRVDPAEVARLKANVEIYESDHERSPSKYTQERLTAAQNELDQYQNKTGTSNFVIFNENDIQITHKNGEPIPTPLDRINQARDLGVVGPPRPSLSEGTPAEAAQRTVMAADAKPGDKVTQEVGDQPNPWRERFDQFVGKIKTGDDVKQLILDAADQNGEFQQARAGDIPLKQFEDITQAAGVDPTTVDRSGIGRLLHNDDAVRNAVQGMLTATEQVKEASRQVKADGSAANLMKFQEALLRRDTWVEQVVGHRAEWGRTGNVFQEFLQRVKDEQSFSEYLKDQDRSPEGLRDLAGAIDGLNDPVKAARFLSDANKPTFWDKYLYYWVNALISGPVTHIKYIGANAAFGAYEALVTTPIAGALGTARRLVSGGTEGVYMGEAAARTWGLLAGTPDAIKAAWTAAKNNVMTPFENEVAGKQVNPLTQVRPSAIGGKLGFALGIPGRSAAGIHSFFRFLGYRAEIEAQAYRAAAKEGLSPLDGQAFWDRRATLADNPTEAMMNAGVENGNHLTFIGEQGTFGQAISRLANTRMGPGGMQPFKLILPFTHIPGQILRAGLELTPASFADAKMRADLLGKNGAVAADTQRARLIGGGAVSAMVANYALNDTLTGSGPTDPTERAQWLRTHEPYSVRLGGWWYSYNKFGPIGDLIGLVSNLVEVGPKVKEGDYADAAGHIIKATAKMLEDEVGMQGLVNLIDALNDPDRKMGRFVAGQAASNLPYSSLLRQTASFNDPTMREAKTFVDQIRYATPWARQDLLPKRDWLGQPMTNPGYQSIIRQRAVNADPVDVAVSQLRGFRPAPPQPRIGGVALPPKMYDEYQMTAGAMAKAGLDVVVRAPGWGEIPPGVREQIVHDMVEKARQTAGSMLQAKHPELIMQGLSNGQDKINGVKPKKLTD